MALVNEPTKLPILLIKNDILLPKEFMRISITEKQGLNLVKSRLLSENTLSSSIFGVVTVEEDNDFDVNGTKIIGTAAYVLQVTTSAFPKNNGYTLLLNGLWRFSLDKVIMREPYPVAMVTNLDQVQESELNSECVEIAQELQKQFNTMIEKKTGYPSYFKKLLETNNVESLPDLVMFLLKCSYEEKKDVLYTLNINERMKKVLSLLQKEKDTKISNVEEYKRGIMIVRDPRLLKVHPKYGVKEVVSPDGLSEMEELHNKIKEANLPTNVWKPILMDFTRLKKMGPYSSEYGMIRSYIEFVVALPWKASSSETIDITKARKDLDKDHYGLDKVKKRILEYIAVRQLKTSVRGPILCFIGPPGVGKTSIARSIAHILGRKFQRISLGGINNHSDIRGHRRTYIGAMPGRIIQAIKNAGVNNPVIVLDEIDKMSSGYNGDPAAALLEVLDPIQNNQFVDHYLNIPFDLSQVTFIATANNIKNIPSPLLDRTETITVTGYTLDEKVNIALHHLLPKQLSENGLDDGMIVIPINILEKLIRNYTLEAGVRNLERHLGALCRSVSVQVAERTLVSSQPYEITVQILEEVLGPSLYPDLFVTSGVGTPGIAVGMAWSPVGGSLLVVEARKVPNGKGKLILTGKLGKVMAESAKLALNYVRGVAHKYGLGDREELMNNFDIHIHFPEGAVSKDGPSAGITIATALISLFADVPLIPGVAISGELTLRGVVLAVGGIREKVLAAHRAGMKIVILPKLSMKSMANVPDKIKEDLHVIYVEHMEEVIEAAFDGLVAPSSRSHLTLQSRL